MYCRRRYAVCHQALGLVLHECYKWRDYYPAPLGQECRQLVADRLATAGRHDDNAVATARCSLYDLVLPGAERVIAIETRQ